MRVDRPRRIASRTHSRKSVATWSLRERAVCSRPAAAPISSPSRFSTRHVDVLELELARARRRAHIRRRSGRVRRGSPRRPPSLTMPWSRSIAACALRCRDVLPPQPLVEGDRGIDLAHHRGRLPRTARPTFFARRQTSAGRATRWAGGQTAAKVGKVGAYVRARARNAHAAFCRCSRQAWEGK